MSEIYASGQLITLSCTFTVSGVPTDPTTVVGTIRFGTASATNYNYPTGTAVGLTRDATGVYHFDFTGVSAGTYYYRFQGTTACVAAEEGSFDVQTSRF